jgi:hypothetical protein
VWVEIYHGRRLEKAINSSGSRSSTGSPELVYGHVSKTDRVTHRIPHLAPTDEPAYYHYMDGAVYYGEVRGGYQNYAQYQPVEVDNSSGESDYVRPYWSCASSVEQAHEWFRLIYSFQVIGQSWHWRLVDTITCKRDAKVLWYTPANRMFRDITDLTSLDFLSGVMIVHVNSIDTTYFAFRTESFETIPAA